LAGRAPTEQTWPFVAGQSESVGAFTSLPKLVTLAVTWRAFTVLQSHTEYVTVPPGAVRESLRTSSPVTQITPGFGEGLGDLVGLGDFDGEGDFVGLGDFDGDGLFVGVVLFDGLGLCVGLELFVGLGVGVFVGLADLVGAGVWLGLADFVGLGVAVALGLVVGCGLTVSGLIAGTFRPEELGLADGSASGIKLACTACVDAVPHTAPSSDRLGAAKTGATVGPASRNSPAPAATATCPTRTILTGTTALR
jgi:hypothetical protein